MGAKYQTLPIDMEKSIRSSYESSATLRDLDHLDYLAPTELDKERVVLKKSLWTQSYWLWLIHAVLLMTSCTFSFLAVTARNSTLSHVRQFSAWSPADVAVRYDAVKYNFTTQGNRFVGYGPEVDKAWREIATDMGDQWISNSDFTNLNMPATHLKVNHPQTGEEGYRIGMEIFHQLHCINLLRQVTYKEYYEPLGGDFGGGREVLQQHTDHCLEVLRLSAQCNTDIGVFSFYLKPDGLAWPELNAKHICRSFDRVRQWAVEHSVGSSVTN